jgi:hypothetical protein
MVAFESSAARLAIVAYSTPAPPAGDVGELRLFRVAFGAIADGTVLRGNLRIAPRRDDPAWAGDYLGFVTGGSRAYVASVDPESGAPQVTLFTGAP